MSAAITPEVVAEAWKLRALNLYTMREIADRLGVERTALMNAMDKSGWTPPQPQHFAAEEPQPRACNHWPGQTRCDWCDLGSSQPTTSPMEATQ